MKSKKFAAILTAVMVLGAVSPAIAYGAAAAEATGTVQDCTNPGNCTTCKAQDCPACTGEDCSTCGGTVKDGICGDCGKEQKHLCRNKDTGNGRHHGHSGQGTSSHHGNGHRSNKGMHC